MSKHLGIRIPSELEKALTELSEATNRTKSYHVKQAIEQYIEDQEDYLEGVQVLSMNNKTYSLEEVKTRLQLDE